MHACIHQNVVKNVVRLDGATAQKDSVSHTTLNSRQNWDDDMAPKVAEKTHLRVKNDANPRGQNEHRNMAGNKKALLNNFAGNSVNRDFSWANEEDDDVPEYTAKKYRIKALPDLSEGKKGVSVGSFCGVN
jgi:hypothetical protein